MTPASTTTLLTQLEDRGIRLWVNGDQLRYRGPRGALTPDLVAAVKQHKPALLRLLAEREAAPAPAPAPAPRLPACGHDLALAVLEVRDHGLICGHCWSRWVAGNIPWPESSCVASGSTKTETSPTASRSRPAQHRSKQ